MREDHKVRISTRLELWEKQNHKCVYCNRTISKEQASLDHIIPIDEMSQEDVRILGKNNLIVCCKRCNKEKLNYIVFTNLYDRIVYPIINIPYFFQLNYIQRNKFKDK